MSERNAGRITFWMSDLGRRRRGMTATLIHDMEQARLPRLSAAASVSPFPIDPAAYRRRGSHPLRTKLSQGETSALRGGRGAASRRSGRKLGTTRGKQGVSAG